MGEVIYRARFTRNMGNFESLQLEVGFSSGPVGDETPSQAYNRVKDFVESRLLDDVSRLEQDIIDTRKAIVDKSRQRKVQTAAETQAEEG